MAVIAVVTVFTSSHETVLPPKRHSFVVTLPPKRQTRRSLHHPTASRTKIFKSFRTATEVATTTKKSGIPGTSY